MKKVYYTEEQLKEMREEVVQHLRSIERVKLVVQHLRSIERVKLMKKSWMKAYSDTIKDLKRQVSELVDAINRGYYEEDDQLDLPLTGAVGSQQIIPQTEGGMVYDPTLPNEA